MSYSKAASERSFEILANDGLRHLVRMDRSLEQIWAKRPPERKEGYSVISDGDIATAIIDFVTHFGHVSTLLFDDGAKRTSENAAVYGMRMDRVNRVAEFFNDIDTSVFKDRKIRNRHFHADEYVSKYLAKFPNAVIVQDLALDKRAIFSSRSPMLYIRTYEYSSDLLLHLEAEFDVKKLYETSLAMIEKLQAHQ